MIDRILTDYVTLNDQFSDISPEAERKIKHAIRRLLETEEYCYIKYQILKLAVRNMQKGLNGDKGVRSSDFIQSAYVGETLVKSLEVKKIAPYESKFRGNNAKS